MADDKNRKITPEELQQHATAKDCWFVIDGIVYDVTKYQDTHPGGNAVMVEHAGKDCTSNFEDIGHSKDARSVMKDMQVGVFDGPTAIKKSERQNKSTEHSESGSGSGMGTGLIMFLVVALAIAGYFVMGKAS